jgi:hypothetical protein
VLEKNGLGLVTEILENYGIDSETDFLVFDQDDFSKLAPRGMKYLHGKEARTLVMKTEVMKYQVLAGSKEKVDL